MAIVLLFTHSKAGSHHGQPGSRLGYVRGTKTVTCFLMWLQEQWRMWVRNVRDFAFDLGNLPEDQSFEPHSPKLLQGGASSGINNEDAVQQLQLPAGAVQRSFGLDTGHQCYVPHPEHPPRSLQSLDPKPKTTLRPDLETQRLRAPQPKKQNTAPTHEQHFTET